VYKWVQKKKEVEREVSFFLKRFPEMYGKPGWYVLFRLGTHKYPRAGVGYRKENSFKSNFIPLKTNEARKKKGSGKEGGGPLLRKSIKTFEP